MNSNILQLFSETIGIYNLNIDSNKIINYLNKVDFFITNASLDKETNSMMSERYDLFKDIELKKLKNECHKCVSDYVNNIMQYEIDYQFVNSWATKVLKNGYSHAHYHAHTLISGVYYPEGDNNFKIKFHKQTKDFFWKLPVKKYNVFNSENWTFDIKKNNLILFPSYLLHEICINNSNKIRYSIAFNINPKGSIGDRDSRVKFN